jgi:hypothetical protein
MALSQAFQKSLIPDLRREQSYDICIKQVSTWKIIN